MTTEKAYQKIQKMLAAINEEDYPEIAACLCYCIDEDEETIYGDPLTVAEELFRADATKQLSGCVADFMIEAYMDAVEMGNADAACDLGALYYTGRCGEQNYAKALEYYTIAAKGGCRQAQENLGYCYYYGRSVEKDYQKAFHYFSLGAFDGHIRSLYKIGDMYRNGYYVKKTKRRLFSFISVVPTR